MGENSGQDRGQDWRHDRGQDRVQDSEPVRQDRTQAAGDRGQRTEDRTEQATTRHNKTKRICIRPPFGNKYVRERRGGAGAERHA